jgi:hypothetical protein
MLALVSTTELLLRTSTWTIRKVPAVHAAPRLPCGPGPQAQRKDGRPSDNRRFEHGQARAASTRVSSASAVALRAGCQRVPTGARRDGLGYRRRPRAEKKSHTQSASFPHAMLHAHRPLESGPRAASLTHPGRAGSHPGHERCCIVFHATFVRDIRLKRELLDQDSRR